MKQLTKDFILRLCPQSVDKQEISNELAVLFFDTSPTSFSIVEREETLRNDSVLFCLSWLCSSDKHLAEMDSNLVLVVKKKLDPFSIVRFHVQILIIDITIKGQNTEALWEKLRTPHDSTACITINLKNHLEYDIISVSQHCGGILAHAFLQSCFSSLRFAGICLWAGLLRYEMV